MKVKKIIQEEMLTLPQVRGELIAIRDKRGDNTDDTEGVDRTLSYELRKSIDHADILSKTDIDTASKLMAELQELEKINPEIAARIVNIMPQSTDEIRAIYAKEVYTMLPEDLNQILEILKKYI